MSDAILDELKAAETEDRDPRTSNVIAVYKTRSKDNLSDKQINDLFDVCFEAYQEITRARISEKPRRAPPPCNLNPEIVEWNAQADCGDPQRCATRALTRTSSPTLNSPVFDSSTFLGNEGSRLGHGSGKRLRALQGEASFRPEAGSTTFASRQKSVRKRRPRRAIAFACDSRSSIART